MGVYKIAYKDRHIISVADFDRLGLDRIFITAEALEGAYKTPAGRAGLKHILKKDGLPLRFRQLFIRAASLRTGIKIEDVVEFLGGEIHTMSGVFSTFDKKNESLFSIVRNVAERCDGIIIRQDDNLTISFREVVDLLHKLHPKIAERINIISAGEGDCEHPTQAVGDMYTIWKKMKDALCSGALTTAFMGDIKSSRVVHSNIILQSLYGGTAFLFCPFQDDLPNYVYKKIEGSGLRIVREADPLRYAPLVQVWHFSRPQINLKGNISPQEAKEVYQELIQKYGASKKLRGEIAENAICLHPQPCNEEYPLHEKYPIPEVEIEDGRFIHHEQAANGFYATMALFKLLYNPKACLEDLEFDEHEVRIRGEVFNLAVKGRDIQLLCAIEKCNKVLVSGCWVEISAEEKSRYVAKKSQTFCPYCQPNPDK